MVLPSSSLAVSRHVHLAACDVEMNHLAAVLVILSPVAEYYDACVRLSDSFLADRTIGRAYGTVCRLSVCPSVRL